MAYAGFVKVAGGKNRVLVRSFALRRVVCLVAVCGAVYSVEATSSGVIRRAIDPGALAILKNGTTLGLEVHPPSGRGAERFLSTYLASGSDWLTYRGRNTVFIPVSRLAPDARRRVILAIYPNDVVDARGWVHTVMDDQETLWSLSEWITGKGGNYRKIMHDPWNNLRDPGLRRGQEVVVSGEFLSAAMRRPTKKAMQALTRSSVSDWTARQLVFGSDSKGEYAVYELKPGEALYTAVALRFTDFTDNGEIVEACRVIARRSGISSIHDIRSGQRIYIPVELLSAKLRFPVERVRAVDVEPLEPPRIEESRASRRPLSDVLVILDSGHGGTDTGAKHPASGLYEDEINYDIAVRIKRLLEEQTGAKVMLTVLDRSSRMAPTDSKRFSNDSDEQLNTTPPHKNDSTASVSANLRWMLVNSIYDRHVRSGGDPSKVVFTSIHTDSLYNSRLRGVMIYTPSAKLRRGKETRTDQIYMRYAEGRQYNKFVSTSAERRRDEALSRRFATVLMDKLGKRRIKRHDQGDPIRSQIRRSRNRVYVPAVLRNTKVPTKILVETANLKNATDRKRLSDPWWRQQFAQAYVDALMAYFGADAKIITARAR